MIDEKKLITEFEEWHDSIEESMSGDFAKSMIKVSIGKIKGQPKVDAWIPCSERLPEDGRSVLVTLTHTYESDYTKYSFARYIDCSNGEYHWCDEHHGWLEWDKYSDGRGGCSHYKVIAWMYLPEPYKEEVNQ